MDLTAWIPLGDIADTADKAEAVSVPISEKVLLSLKEASAYSGVGINSLRKYIMEHTELICKVGKKRLIKREPLRDYLIRAEKII